MKSNTTMKEDFDGDEEIKDHNYPPSQKPYTLPIQTKLQRDQAEQRKEEDEIDALLISKVMKDNHKQQKIDKKKKGIVRSSEICLFCNLQDIFTKYAYMERSQESKSIADDSIQVLQPKQVRNALNSTRMDGIGYQQFQEGDMECAQETLDEILRYLHREYVDPNYLETFVQMNADGRWEMNNHLDNMGCTPQCASHAVFGIQTMNTIKCEKCDIIDEISVIAHDFADNYYVEEILSTAAQMN